MNERGLPCRPFIAKETMRTANRLRLILILALLATTRLNALGQTEFVDPRIGSEGLGRVFIGP